MEPPRWKHQMVHQDFGWFVKLFVKEFSVWKGNINISVMDNHQHMWNLEKKRTRFRFISYSSFRSFRWDNGRMNEFVRWNRREKKIVARCQNQDTTFHIEISEIMKWTRLKSMMLWHQPSMLIFFHFFRRFCFMNEEIIFFSWFTIRNEMYSCLSGYEPEHVIDNGKSSLALW